MKTWTDAGGGNGYDRIEEAAASGGWRPVPCWGRDGWDLGEWPLYVVSHREVAGPGDSAGFGLRTDIEGDITERVFATRTERDLATDALAIEQWTRDEEAWAQGKNLAPGDPMLGPYRRERACRVPDA